MESVLDKIIQIVADQLCVPKEELKAETVLRGSDLMDSLDIVEINMRVEDDFGIEIPDMDAEKFQTIQDIVTYVESRKS